ncbi:hypothetical protein Tco_0542140 [Tanacetum coccineum]
MVYASKPFSSSTLTYINLLSKKDVVIGLPKLKYVKDQLCSSCEVSKAKRSSFKSKTVPSSKDCNQAEVVMEKQKGEKTKLLSQQSTTSSKGLCSGKRRLISTNQFLQLLLGSLQDLLSHNAAHKSIPLPEDVKTAFP